MQSVKTCFQKFSWLVLKKRINSCATYSKKTCRLCLEFFCCLMCAATNFYKHFLVNDVRQDSFHKGVTRVIKLEKIDVDRC